MIRTQESTGKTVDEAFAKACALLGVQAEDENVSREVLEYPQKTGFLGLKTCRRLPPWQRKFPLLWQSLPLPPQSRHLLPSSPPKLPRRQKRWKSPSSSRRTPR